MLRMRTVLGALLLLTLGVWLFLQPSMPSHPAATLTEASSAGVENAAKEATAAQLQPLRRTELAGINAAHEPPPARAEEDSANTGTALRIRVVDIDGEPVENVRVGYYWIQGGLRDDLLTRTNTNGWAKIPFSTHLLEELRHINGSAVLMGLRNIRAQQSIDLHDLPDQGVILKMPPAGKILVSLSGVDGQPFLEKTGISLLMARANREPPEYGQVLTTVTSTGEASLNNIDLGQTFELRVFLHGTPLFGKTQFQGPTDANPEVAVKLTVSKTPPTELAEQSCYIVGQLFFADGKVAAKIPLSAILTTCDTLGEGASTEHSGTQTDIDGFFRVKIRQPKTSKGKLRTLTLNRRGEFGQDYHAAFLPLDEDLPPGETNVGELRFAPIPRLVAGTVFAPDGSPLADAQVGLDIFDSDRGGWSSNSGLLAPTAQSGEDGSYSLHGRVVPGVYRVRAWHRLYSKAVGEIELGAQNVDLRMPATAALKWNLLLDEDVPKDSLAIQLEYISMEKPGQDLKNVGNHWISGGGAGALYGLELGVVNLMVICRDTHEVLAHIDRLSLVTEDGRPQDVGDIDLRNQLRWYLLRWVTKQGSVLNSVQLYPFGIERSVYSWKGAVLVVTKQLSNSFLVRSKGYLAQELLDVSADRTVTFQKGFEVTIRVENAAEVPAAPNLFLVVHGAEEHNKHFRAWARKRDRSQAKWETTIALEDVGAFRIAGTISAGGKWTAVQAEDEQPQFWVEDSTENQTFSIRISPSAVQATLEQLSD